MPHENDMDPTSIEQFKVTLMKLNGVQAVGESVADGKPCLKVYFMDKATMTSTLIPDSIGIPVVKVVSGSIQSQ